MVLIKFQAPFNINVQKHPSQIQEPQEKFEFGIKASQSIEFVVICKELETGIPSQTVVR